MFHLLQICNVGNIFGGTAACAWSVKRCFPDCRHTVVFLSPISAETETAFAHVSVLRWPCVSVDRVAATEADLILLHNTPASRCDARLPVPTIQYLHSCITPASADDTIACSYWLAAQRKLSPATVVHQPVPRPRRLEAGGHRHSERVTPVIGRICTPQRHKWPADIVPFYHRLSERHPAVRWEFVGCPDDLQRPLQEACHGRAAFHPASRDARSRLWDWDAMLYHHPTLTESFGRTVAEAMRAGCIPIVDNRGGFREQIADGCGFLCRTEDEFHAAVATVLPRENRVSRSQRCRAHADTAFSLRKFRQHLLDRLRSL